MIEIQMNFKSIKEEALIRSLVVYIKSVLGDKNGTVTRGSDGIRFESEEINYSAFVLQFEVYEDKYIVDVNSIVIPDEIRTKGMCKKLITFFMEKCVELELDLFIIEIVNRAWYLRLVENGAEIENEEILFINPQKWQKVK